jgi:hypothetical protein
MFMSTAYSPDSNIVCCSLRVKYQLGAGGSACSRSYSGGKEQEDLALKPTRANNSRDPVLKKTYHKKRTGGVAQGVDLEFKSQHHKKKKKLNTLG